ncbi:facilitated trehalose transporter Tret1-like isoform X2 [Oratosquilla oratoria]
MLMELFGLSRLMNWCVLPSIACWIIMAYVPSKIALYLGRIGNGLAYGIIVTVATPLMAELTSPEIRGMLGSIRKMEAAIGTLIMYIMAAFLHWKLATALSALPLVPVLVLFFFVPESPYWLARKGRDEDSLKSLSFLRGSKEVAQLELDRIKKAIDEQPSVNISDQFRNMMKPQNYKPVLIVALFYFVSPMAGQGVIFQYTVFVFQLADPDLDPFMCTIYVGVTRVLSTIVALFITDLIDRRPLLIGSGLFCSLSFIMTSVVIMVPVFPRWLIPAFILLYVFSLCIGVSFIPTLVMSEIIPTPVRSLGTSICMQISLVMFFIASITFPPIIDGIGLENALFFFASMNALLAFIFWTLVPETRGRSLVDLQNVFMKRNLIFMISS